MIHYHGTPITPDDAAVQILTGRHGLVSFANPRQITLVAEVCQSFVLDNGAFTFWKTGRSVDTEEYYSWVSDWKNHPAFDWALIPDVIEGSEAQNDELLMRWPFSEHIGVPVWHLHESVDRLVCLAKLYPRIAFGSSAEYSKVGSEIWWQRMAEALSRIVDEHGQPISKLHGLRMLNKDIFTKLPFSSADSTNVARNIGLDVKWKGTYAPPTKGARGIAIANKVEAHQSAPFWRAA